MRKLLHIGLALFALLCVLQITWDGNAVPSQAIASAPVSATAEMCSIDRKAEELRQIVFEALESDTGPFSYARGLERTSQPVTRLNPYLKFTAGVIPRIMEPQPASESRTCCQERLSAGVRAGLDAAGFYVFALRKIII